MKKLNKNLIAWFYGFILIGHFKLVFADTVSDTEKLFNWAEGTYAELFPSHQSTQSFESWLFRFYPETNVYAGVNQADNSAYVAGGSWGNDPVFIDTLPNLIGLIPSTWAGAVPIHKIPQTASEIAVAMSANGDAVAVWLENDFGIGINSVWAAHYSADANAWSEVKLLDSGAQSAHKPKVAMDANGNAMVIWMQQLGIEFNAWAARYQADSGWEEAVLLENENSAVNGGFPQSDIAMDGAGNAIAIWSQRIGVQSFIYANRYTAGQGWSAAVSIDPDIPGQIDASFNPRVAMDNNGNAIAVWSNIQSSNIRTSRYTVNDNTWSPTPQELGPGIQPDVAMSNDGSAVVVANSRVNSANVYKVAAWHYHVNSSWDTTAKILDEGRAAESESTVRVAMDAAGNAVAAWSQLDSRGLISGFANHFNHSSGWNGPVLIEANDAEEVSSDGIDIGMDSSGNAIAAWMQKSRTNSPTDNWANQMSAGTSAWSTPALLEPVTSVQISAPRLATNANGKAVAVWFQSDEFNREVYLVANIFR